ncbi:hypothetical protein ACLOJK_014513 [Asimina triloba]
MASAIFKTSQNPTSLNTQFHFPSENLKKLEKQSVNAADIIKLCSENRLKEAVGCLDSIPKECKPAGKASLYDCLLRSLAVEGDPILARKVYNHMIQSNLHKNGYFGTKITHIFVECGSLADAANAFEAVEHKNLWLWSVILNGFCKAGLFDGALELYRDFSTSCLRADGFILSSILRACGGLRNSRLGREVHGFVYRNGHESNVFVCNCLVDMYGKCGLVRDARNIFDRILHRDVVSWNSVLKCYCQGDNFDGFAGLVAEIAAGGVKPNLITWNSIIAGFAFYGHAKEALNCFYQMQKMGMKPDVISCNSLMSALARCGYFKEALELIKQMQKIGLEPDITSWTTLVSGLVNFGLLNKALRLFARIQFSKVALDELVFCAVLKACSGLGALRQGREIHGYIVRNGFRTGDFLGAYLLHMYSRCGKLDSARKLLLRNNIFSWNSLIAGYVQNGFGKEAKELFKCLQSEPLKPDLVSWNIMIDSNAREGNTRGALDILDHMLSTGISPDLVTWNSIIKGHTKSMQTDGALQTLHQMESSGFKPNSVSWNTLISNHVSHGSAKEALITFHSMRKHGTELDEVTLSSILHACAILGAMGLGKSVHGFLLRRNFRDNFITSALLLMYIRCGNLDAAWKVFVATPRNLVLWNVMISGFAKNGRLSEAHGLLGEMQLAKLNPDVISWTSVFCGYAKSGNAIEALEICSQMWRSGVQLDPIALTAASAACARLREIKGGKEIHGFSITSGLEKDPSVQAALISMYSKCGFMNEAALIFKGAPHTSTLIWNSMISGYVMHGHEELALSLFHRMKNEGVDANLITCAAISACCPTNPDVKDGMFQELGSFKEIVDIAIDVCKLEDEYLECSGS